jgi:hypothetical protein
MVLQAALAVSRGGVCPKNRCIRIGNLFMHAVKQFMRSNLQEAVRNNQRQAIANESQSEFDARTNGSIPVFLIRKGLESW